MKIHPDNVTSVTNTTNNSIFFRIFISLLVLIASAGSIGSILLPKAQAFPSGHFTVHVGASIGQFYISLSGFIAPYASVVLTTDNVVLRSVAADPQGFFSISQVLVKYGFTHFCFSAVDVKRLGQSDACFTIPSVTKDVSRTNIFLPPTIGLFRSQITVGSSALIWGYSMPGAVVSIHATDGKIYTATADKTGFYQITTRIDKAGNYDLFATAVLNKQPSEKPTNKVTLVALTLSQQTGQNISNWLKNLLTFLFNLPLGPLWLAVPILILIFILWRKLQGKPLIPQHPFAKEKLFFDYLFRPKKLHHSWFVGY